MVGAGCVGTNTWYGKQMLASDSIFKFATPLDLWRYLYIYVSQPVGRVHIAGEAQAVSSGDQHFKFIRGGARFLKVYKGGVQQNRHGNHCSIIEWLYYFEYFDTIAIVSFIFSAHDDFTQKTRIRAPYIIYEYHYKRERCTPEIQILYIIGTDDELDRYIMRYPWWKKYGAAQ